MSHPVHTQALQAQCRIDTPLGPMRLAATARGLAGAWFEDQRHHPGPLAAPEDARHPVLRAAATALAAHWRGEWPAIGDSAHPAVAPGTDPAPDHGTRPQVHAMPGDRQPWEPLQAPLVFDLAGTPFQQAVWRALQSIPPGQTRDYAGLAAALGRPNAARAVGAAVGRNPVSVLLPCHRVLGRGGRLTGYAGGLARKQALLAHEAGHATNTLGANGVLRLQPQLAPDSAGGVKQASAARAQAAPRTPLATN
jgi:methylated-DNA-[protein]-cysteine S-methyltransferase